MMIVWARFLNITAYRYALSTAVIGIILSDGPTAIASPPDSHTFTCLGDGGGPIARKSGDKSKYVQVGVISWAVGCGANDNPSVSANLYRYARWVRAAMPHFVSGERVSFQENQK